MARALEFAPPLHTTRSLGDGPDTDIEAQSPQSSPTDHGHGPFSSSSESIRQRRPVRSSTVKTYRPERKGAPWQVGGEPGIDTSATHEGHPLRSGTQLHEECEILVADFSQDRIQMHRWDNRTLVAFMDQPRPDWAKCRWINVDGLSWDVIKLLGNDKGLHRLAIEDMMNTKNRTKADWYSDHTFGEYNWVYHIVLSKPLDDALRPTPC